MQPLEKRPLKAKKPVMTFFCPLCRSERSLSRHRDLRSMNYMQILMTSVVLGMVLFPYFGVKVFILPIPIWAGFELVFKLLYRKEIPCPHCGFDATWYRRDVKLARKVVQEFWQNNHKQKSEEEQINQNSDV